MKKIVLILVTISTILNAGFFSFNTEKKHMLKATLFSKFEKKVAKEPLMIEFGSVNCHSCQIMGENLYEIKQKYPDANIYFINIFKDKEAAKKFKIQMIPTQKFLDKNGSIIDTHIGVIERDELEEKLKHMGIIK